MDNILNTDKFLTNIEKIMKITGFYVTATGDDSVGIFPATWEINNDFYFDNQEQLDEFKVKIKSFFEEYCGEVTSVVSFEEHQLKYHEEMIQLYSQYPIRYLIKIKDGNNFKIASATASYSNNIGEGIHFELPHWMSEDGYNGYNTKIIKSNTKEFKDILIKEAGRLEKQIHDDEYRLSIAKRNLELIEAELHYGN